VAACPDETPDELTGGREYALLCISSYLSLFVSWILIPLLLFLILFLFFFFIIISFNIISLLLFINL
jgi:hypothetical protein